MESTKKHSIHGEQHYVVRVTALSRRLKIFILATAIIGLPIVSALVTYYVYGAEERELQAAVKDQEQEIDRLTKEVNYARQMQKNAEVSSEVDRLAIEALRKENVVWNDRNTLLEEKINFYKSLMDPNPTNSGVYVESMEIKNTGTDGLYRYRIIVAQRSSNHQRVSGKINLELFSEKNSDGIQSIPLNKLTDGEDQLTLGFKFFQQIDGSLKLPDGFVPEKIRLQVRMNGRGSKRFEELIDWQVQS